MYTFFLVIQVIVIISFFVEVLTIYRQKNSRNQQLLFVCAMAGFINAIGYMLELVATEQSLALQAVKFSYVGKVYLPVLMFLFTMNYCKINLSHRVSEILLGIHTLVLVAVLSCENHTLYYSSIDYVREGFFPHLVLGHGVLYNAYFTLVFAYFIASPVVCLIRRKKTTDVQERRRLILLPLIMLFPLFGLLAFLLKLTGGYDATALCYLLSSAVLMVLTLRDKIFDTLEIAKEEIIDSLSDGVVIIDNEERLLYINKPAAELFPHTKNSSEIAATIELLHQYAKEKSKELAKGAYYMVVEERIFDNRAERGRIFSIKDVTVEYRYTEALESEVNTKTQQIRRLQHRVIGSFADIISARDDSTGEHVKRTSYYVELIARQLQTNSQYGQYLNDEMVQDIVDAAPLHDIGKVSIPDSVLNKPARLTAEEFEIIKTHAKIGGRMIEKVLDGVESDKYLAIARDIALYHHEHWDGGGYPNKLCGEEIPLAARIMAICDVYDALVSERCYKKALSAEDSYKIIVEGAGTQFDPIIVDAFCKQFEKIRTY